MPNAPQLGDEAPMQRICGWCRKEIAPGSEPATYGICPRCFVRFEEDAKEKGRRRVLSAVTAKERSADERAPLAVFREALRMELRRLLQPH